MMFSKLKKDVCIAQVCVVSSCLFVIACLRIKTDVSNSLVYTHNIEKHSLTDNICIFCHYYESTTLSRIRKSRTRSKQSIKKK